MQACLSFGIFCCAVFCLFPLLYIDGREQFQVGEIVLEENPGEAISKWSKAPWAQAVPEGPDGGTCMRIKIPSANIAADGSVQKDVWGREIKLTTGNFSIQRPLDLKLLRGWRVKLVARVKTANVTPPKLPWEGVRIGLNYRTPLISYDSNLTGQPENSDWHDAILANARIPEDAVETSLNLGLIASEGTLWVDNIRLVLIEPPMSILASQREPFIQKAKRRGAGIARSTFETESLAKSWGLNVVKYWLDLPSHELSDDEYNSALEKELIKFDGVLKHAEKANIKVILQLSSWYPEKSEDGIAKNGNTHRVFTEPKLMMRFIETWKVIAKRYIGSSLIEGYDIMNEPVLRVPLSEGCLDWEGLAEAVALSINEIDPNVQIFVQPEEWWGVQSFTKLRQINAKNITYSVHMYSPFEVTHQGITERKSMGFSYPSTINGKLWDKDALRQALKPARDFQLAYGVPMQVGEFSCIRWAPDGSSARWLKDVIEIFEEYGWDWTYHAFRDWDGWDPALGEDPANLNYPTEPSVAKKVLLAAFAKNLPLESSQVKPGDIVCQINFDDPAEQAKWSQAPWAKWIKDESDGRTVLKVEVPASEQPGHHMISMPFDVEKYRGMVVFFECMAKADKVTKAPQSWNGVKFMFHYLSKSAGEHWNNQANVFGSFDWKKLSFISSVAADATNGDIYLGLEMCTGTAYFKDIKITVARGKPKPLPTPIKNHPPAYKGHDLSRLRGVMSPGKFKEEDIRVLGQDWKANLIRWQLTTNWAEKNGDRDLEKYDAWLDGKLAELDQAFIACEKYGIKVVIDLHSPPGGRYEDGGMAIFHEKLYQDHFVKLWRKIASRYKGRQALWAYDLINEPMQAAPPPKGIADYLGAQFLAAKAIREIDPTTTIIIASNEWNSPYAFAYLEPLDIPNVIYQVHMYIPCSFTHQGVYDIPEKPLVYPGVIDGKRCDKEALREHLKPVRDFQLAYNVHIYVGEFSAIRWAPGNSALNYLRDCIEIFEEYGWDWSYHAFREWDGWSLEHGEDKDDKNPTQEPTDRMKMMLEWFRKNEKP